MQRSKGKFKELLFIIGAAIFLFTCFPGTNRADDASSLRNSPSDIVRTTFKHIDFSHCAPLRYEVFQTAYTGYLLLTRIGKTNPVKHILTICDLELTSISKRMWVIDLDRGIVLFNTLVAHGKGSGVDRAERFSNKQESHCSSLGFYCTGDIYCGDHGRSLRLSGLDTGFNDAAEARGIVLHGADYVSTGFISQTGRLGRSFGCPAVPADIKDALIDAITDRTCLFIYYPDPVYLSGSGWLIKTI